MGVPEAAVDEDRYPMARERDVRRSRQATTIQPESVAHGVDEATDGEFRSRVLVLDRPHDARARLVVHG
jgi:hypothetical protein